ncbi:Flocculation suppression protein [Coniosporium tulheliwenetii]|uniref:Flocculation suppression protein n=1 Tax=Coniosporium tulheliwenetii TaxID=3383036 RepID=A0ACC2ZQ78_9PEZI|nr:Flocculation suppression protein [Cladosporium sp. JES 115]
MYGFHKVSDVFHTGAPDSPLWEFKHGNGNFKRGDLVGLREIKRRASRHALIHRDSFPAGPKVAAPPLPGTPVEPMPDPVEARLSMLEHNLYDMHNRVARSEDAHAYVTSKCQMLTDGLLRCHQWSHEIANYIMVMVPDPENQLHKDVALMQREIARQTEMLRAFDEPQEPPPAARPSYFQQHVTEPLSPRQMAHDDRRRPSLAGSSHPGSFRAPVPPHLAVSPRRYGSIGSNNSPSSIRTPNYAPPPPPPPPVIQHPLATPCAPPHLGRHPRARLARPAAPSTGPLPYASGQNSTQWPSSPHRAPSLAVAGDQSLRDALAAYEINRNPRAAPHQQGHGSRQPTPPLVSDTGSSNLSAESGWNLPGPRYPFRGIDTPGPPTRRSSMASNVHSLLNPAETVERADEDEGVVDDRKRKRVQ